MKSYSGAIAIVGRPNVGKSTLLNHLVGQKVSITARKPQTTRHRIVGIKTTEAYQILFVDTPGIHQDKPFAMNRVLNRTALRSLKEVDGIVMMVSGFQWTPEDEWVAKKLSVLETPWMLAINQVDRIKEKARLLPYIQKLEAKLKELAPQKTIPIVPISAKTGAQVDTLEKVLVSWLPEGPHFYPEDQFTDRSERFLVAEIIREKLIRSTGQEVPYATAVQIESFEEDEKGVVHIHALIWVEKPGQKIIVLGAKGERMKEIGMKARLDIEKLLGKRVFLKTWIKVKPEWSDNPALLRQLGYSD